MKQLIGSIIEDCLSVKGVPTATAGAVLARVMGKRHQLLREVIAAEFRQGNFDRADEDEIISICYRLIRDAEEGVAKNNLRLMARVINGMAEKNELRAPSFLKYANVLASLTEDEITVLAVMSKLNWATFMPQEAAAKFKEHGIENYQAIQQALLRTGLVSMQIRNDLIGDVKHVIELKNKKIDSGFIFTLTPLFTEIEKYIKTLNSFEEAA